ncbi:hypothetical protein [Moraxella cuniculi]|uniref:Uncharacterized protein n=1 Tax=Moraxella cuniculi TaxID=34061 RepID=A0A448GY20_9GAMM|nr:hypothetical protein [Moraxella cuniculi]VEG13744.1 Uncharacterised protein [Moraxella cuniculi]
MSILFPNCDDYISRYGCDSILNDDFTQLTTFYYQKFKLSILTDCYDFIDIKLYCNDFLISHLYEEGVDRITLFNNNIKVFFKEIPGYFDNKFLELIVDNNLSIKSVSMRS